jgi:hypothetical protein
MSVMVRAGRAADLGSIASRSPTGTGRQTISSISCCLRAPYSNDKGQFDRPHRRRPCPSKLHNGNIRTEATSSSGGDLCTYLVAKKEGPPMGSKIACRVEVRRARNIAGVWPCPHRLPICVAKNGPPFLSREAREITYGAAMKIIPLQDEIYGSSKSSGSAQRRPRKGEKGEMRSGGGTVVP